MKAKADAAKARRRRSEGCARGGGEAHRRPRQEGHGKGRGGRQGGQGQGGEGTGRRQGGGGQGGEEKRLQEGAESVQGEREDERQRSVVEDVSRARADVEALAATGKAKVAAVAVAVDAGAPPYVATAAAAVGVRPSIFVAGAFATVAAVAATVSSRGSDEDEGYAAFDNKPVRRRSNADGGLGREGQRAYLEKQLEADREAQRSRWQAAMGDGPGPESSSIPVGEATKGARARRMNGLGDAAVRADGEPSDEKRRLERIREMNRVSTASTAVAEARLREAAAASTATATRRRRRRRRRCRRRCPPPRGGAPRRNVARKRRCWGSISAVRTMTERLGGTRRTSRRCRSSTRNSSGRPRRTSGGAGEGIEIGATGIATETRRRRRRVCSSPPPPRPRRRLCRIPIRRTPRTSPSRASRARRVAHALTPP